jgi:hypothetical protein
MCFCGVSALRLWHFLEQLPSLALGPNADFSLVGRPNR